MIIIIKSFINILTIISANGWTCDWRHHRGRNSFRTSDVVYGCPTIHQCDWGICQGCWNKITASLYSNLSLQSQKSLLEPDNSIIACHFKILILINIQLMEAFPFIDLAQKDPFPGSLAFYIFKYKTLIFNKVKESPFQLGISKSTTKSSSFEIQISRPKALQKSRRNEVDNEAQWSVFAQAFRQIHSKNSSALRIQGQLYNTTFLGEYSQDAGGPYR